MKTAKYGDTLTVQKRFFNFNRLYFSMSRLFIIFAIYFVLSAAALVVQKDYNYINWAGNVRFTAPKFIQASTVEEVQAVVKSAKNVRLIASTHAANRQVETNDTLLSIRSMNKVLGVDENNIIHVQGGCSFSDILPVLVERKLEMPSMLCTPDLSIVGTILTASHGSGMNAPILNSLVRELEVVRADGSLEIITGSRLDLESLSLGLLGVVVSIKLQLYPAFELKQCVYTDVPFSHFVSLKTNPEEFEQELIEKQSNFNAVFREGFSVSLFTLFGQAGELGAGAEFLGRTNPLGPINVEKAVLSSIWVKKSVKEECKIPLSRPSSIELSDDEIWHWGGVPSAQQAMADIATVPILPGRDPATSTASSPALAHQRLPHFIPGADADGANGSHDELQTEYFLPSQHSSRVLSLLLKSDFLQDLVDVIHISELRVIQSYSTKERSISPCPFSSLEAETDGLLSDNLTDTFGRVNLTPIPVNPDFSGCLTLQFTWSQKHNERAMEVMAKVEAIIGPLGARPHWGKLFAFTPAQLASMYSEETILILADYSRAVDPTGKFRNSFLNKFIVNNEHVEKWAAFHAQDNYNDEL